MTVLPNSVPSGAAKFKPCTGNGLRSIFGFLSFCRRLNDMVFSSCSPVGRRWAVGKGPVRPRGIGRDTSDQGISKPVRRGNGLQKDPPVRRRAREGRLDRAAVFAAEVLGLLDRKGPVPAVAAFIHDTVFCGGSATTGKDLGGKGPVHRSGRRVPYARANFWKPVGFSACGWHGVSGSATVSRLPPPARSLHRFSRFGHASVGQTTVVCCGENRDDSPHPAPGSRCSRCGFGANCRPTKSVEA